MARIAKYDYFVGVFITTILKPNTNKAPILCDAPGDTKQVLFESGRSAFNVYVQYSMKNVPNTKKKRTYWQVSFSEQQYLYLKTRFRQDKRKNLVAMVCTDKKLSDTRIAILPVEDALLCLGQTTNNGARYIVVSRTGNEHTFSCYGAGGFNEKYESSIRPYVNHLRYFDDLDQEVDCTDY